MHHIIYKYQQIYQRSFSIMLLGCFYSLEIYKLIFITQASQHRCVAKKKAPKKFHFCLSDIALCTEKGGGREERLNYEETGDDSMGLW